MKAFPELSNELYTSEEKEVLLSEIKVSYRTHRSKQSYRVLSSQDAASIFRKCYNRNTIELREEFRVMYLNQGNYVIGVCEHSIGSLSGTIVDVKLIIATALKTLASGIILCHNHPSGNKKPSQADLRITADIKTAAAYFGITLLDHVILTTDGYTSLADEGEV